MISSPDSPGFHKMWNRSGLALAAYIPFYPDCMTTFIADTDVAERPIRIFGGMADDYNPIAPCKAYAERLKAADTRARRLTKYYKEAASERETAMTNDRIQ